jgi:hypothetical protein
MLIPFKAGGRLEMHLARVQMDIIVFGIWCFLLYPSISFLSYFLALFFGLRGSNHHATCDL